MVMPLRTRSPALQSRSRVSQAPDDPRETQPDTTHIHSAVAYISRRSRKRKHRPNLQSCLRVEPLANPSSLPCIPIRASSLRSLRFLYSYTQTDSALPPTRWPCDRL
ncbi:hypothetical protein BD310DRAFT_246599 [Dichomitus squalens]|uniref:Uncharacterized protein n=1 Tax=Dichomitus squalens TaxID=114155 RepID=A0A4Q9PDU7_9APHY|nr:hypothetical protein BD310DRAFT_246599 [Dichomitus squalens]